MKLFIEESNISSKNKLTEKSNFDDVEKAVKYYYNKWYHSDMSYDDIASDLSRLGHNDDFIDAVLDGISERYEDEEDYELDDYGECLTEDSLDDIVIPEIKRRYIWPLCEDSSYEIVEIIEKYQNTNRFKDEINSFDLKEISYMDYPAFQLEIECSYEVYVLIKKDIERAGLYIEDEEDRFNSFKDNQFEAVEIDVKHSGILEVPDGKNVNDLPFSHFEKLAKKKGLSKITKALNNLQVWNKNDDKKLSKWAGNMIDKLNKKLKKDESVLRESQVSDDYFDDEIYDDFSKQDKEIAKRMLELGWEEVGFLTTGMKFILPKTDSDENGGYETTIILPSDGKIGNIYRIDDFDEDKSTIVKNDSGTKYLHDIDDVEKFTKWFMSLPDKSIKKESRSLGGRDYGYIDPVLQEYLDFLDEAGIVVVNVNPKSKTVYVNNRDFDDAVFYMQDRDYFGKDLHSKGWIVATRA